ncbi:MAG: hypothetical protein ACOCWG_02865, partial [bacterium]
MKLLASSVVRLTNKGSTHGHLYLIDVDKDESTEVLKWDNTNINWEGRGNARGLRGIAFYEDSIIVASGTHLLFLDKKFNIKKTFEHRLLGDIHEIFLYGNELVVTSTLYDLILFLNIETMKMSRGYYIVPQKIKSGKSALFHRKLIAIRVKLLYRFFNSKSKKEFIFKKIDPAVYEPVKTNSKK